uniref:Uncharacterized protein n=1 Tax=Arundo donax TaxID=35708 RepID=A0A0A8XSJ4_ARUDO
MTHRIVSLYLFNLLIIPIP